VMGSGVQLRDSFGVFSRTVVIDSGVKGVNRLYAAENWAAETLPT